MQFDVIVIGGGHAGVEAVLAAQRRGCRAGLVTATPGTIGSMSCNPAIGGVGKGHLVRELDIFDGAMCLAADRAAIHYRMLNRSKGSAVHGPRVQADRRAYRTAIQEVIAGSGVEIIADEAVSIDLTNGMVRGIALAGGVKVSCTALVVATGTFLNGRLFCGTERRAGGRVGEHAATALAHQFRSLGLPMGRLKTGTPPRLDGRKIDWARLARQPSDIDAWTMSPMSNGRSLPAVACGITRTNLRTHDIIRQGLDRSPLHSGAIEGRGPRYCPSIEDKVARFGDRDGHQIFLEPEGLDDATIYPNGISTSLALDTQSALIRSIEGLEHADIVQPGYAVEYDHIDPRHLDADLQVRDIAGLFCAGQINGTTGYEEAAAQGLVAGLNAAALALCVAPVRFDRRQSYIGVMIDDLTLQGVTEPYRMLTARAERRLYLRADNAATRLGRHALQSDAIGQARRAWLEDHHEKRAHAIGSNLDDVDIRLRAELADDARYAPYISRQDVENEAVARGGGVALHEVDFAAIAGLSSEMTERLSAARPATLADAGRIRGITPAAPGRLNSRNLL